MEGQIFVGIIEDWLKGLSSRIGGETLMEPSRFSEESSIPAKDLQRFKSWFSLALRLTDVWSGNIPVTPEEFVFRTAVKETHSKLLKALSMFTDKELADLFGVERANQIRGVANEISFAPVQTFAIRSAVEVA